MFKHTNKLIDETSPYLLQHAHNPVQWYSWGEEALQKAKEEDKPILLSIGYAACHWCHVMERESFENEEIAALMNNLYISIKVDREERPDIDQLYMTFVQLYNGNGGWPMTVILTPQGEPFFGGTYFPPENRYGRPGFKRILKDVALFYHNEKQKLSQNLQQINMALDQPLQETSPKTITDKDMFDEACMRLSELYEPEYGGIGKAPKFPAVQVLSLFLRKYQNDGDKLYLDMVTQTLDNMGRGGIYDQLGGGFARYSVDDKWLIPHFEKMLYDNAQLITLYLDAYLITKKQFYLDIAHESLEFILREMTSEDGGFYSSIDADSEGHEGKFYVWDKKEILDLLGKQSGDIFCYYFGITKDGNFEGKNILHQNSDVNSTIKKHNITESELENILTTGKKLLYTNREKRTRPALDDKVIVSWNGLMLSAFARAYQLTRDERWADALKSNINFIKNKLYKNGRLLHTYRDNQAKISAFFDDYSHLIQGLLDAYEAVFDIGYLKWALELTTAANEQFYTKDEGGYFYTTGDQKYLIRRLKDKNDQSVPSGTGIMLQNLLRLYSITENQVFISIVEEIFSATSAHFNDNPYSYASYLNALDFYLNKPKEIFVLKPTVSNAADFLSVVFEKYLPNKVLIVVDDGHRESLIGASLLIGKTIIGENTTVYVCHNFICSLPLTDPQELKKLIFE